MTQFQDYVSKIDWHVLIWYCSHAPGFTPNYFGTKIEEGRLENTQVTINFTL